MAALRLSRPLPACSAICLLLAVSLQAAAADPELPAPVAHLHVLLDSHEIASAEQALRRLAAERLTPVATVAVTAGRGRLLQLTYRLRESADVLSAAVHDADAAGATQLAARIRVWEAQALLGLGDLPQAEALTTTATDVLVASGDLRGEFSAIQLKTNFSHVNQRALMERQLAIARTLSDPALESRVRNRWASALLGAGRSGPGLAEAEAAERLARSSGPVGDWLVAHALGYRAWALRAHGDYAQSLACNRQAVAIAMRHGDYESAAWNWLGVAVSQQGLARFDDMSISARRGLAVARLTAMPAVVQSLTASVALSDFARGRWATAAALYEAALAKPLGDSPVYTTVQLAACKRHLGQLDVALQLSDRALTEARAREEPDGETQVLAERAEILQALGRPVEARDAVQAAIDRLETLRRQLAPADFLKRGFGDAHAGAYAVAVDVLARQGRYDEALLAAERARARALADLLLTRRSVARDRAADASDATWRLGGEQDLSDFHDTPVDAASSGAGLSWADAPALDPAALSGLAKSLDSTLIVYWMHDTGCYAWVVHQDGQVNGARLPLSRTAIDALVLHATTDTPALSLGGATAPDTKPSPARLALRRLYGGLIAPIEANLPSTAGARLTIIPHGSLFQLSFAALVDARGRYLIERYAMHYAPGGAALAAALDAHAGHASGAGALLVADPTPSADAAGLHLPPLTGARAEVRLVDSLLDAVHVDRKNLVGDAATEAAVRADAPQARLLHFAAHAIATDRGATDPYISLARPRDPKAPSDNDGRLTATEIYALPLSADLVVLSACRSAHGPISSDGLADLTRAFIAAGAPSVVASLWDAADQPTARLMREFYRGYTAGMPKDQALRAAQLHLIRDLRAGRVRVETGDTSTVLPEHPLFWAGFILAGRN